MGTFFRENKSQSCSAVTLITVFFHLQKVVPAPNDFLALYICHPLQSIAPLVQSKVVSTCREMCGYMSPHLTQLFIDPFLTEEARWDKKKRWPRVEESRVINPQMHSILECWFRLHVEVTVHRPRSAFQDKVESVSIKNLNYKKSPKPFPTFF